MRILAAATEAPTQRRALVNTSPPAAQTCQQTHLCRLATFYSRSRRDRWCKGETSGHYIKVTGVFPDCDRDSLIYLGDPIGPACHTVRPLCHNFKHMLTSDIMLSDRLDETNT